MIQAPFTWWSSVLLYCHPRGGKKKKKKLFPSLIIFTEEQHFVQTVQFCVCVPIIIIIRCISILQVLQACVQDEKKKNIYMCLMVMLPIRHLNINIKHQSTNSHGEISCYWFL